MKIATVHGVFDEGPLIEATILSVRPALNECVARALGQGLSLETVAVLIERTLDGQTAITSGSRDALRQRFSDDPVLDDEGRLATVAALTGAGPDDLPVIVIVHQKDHITFGHRYMEARLSVVGGGPPS